MVLGKIFITSDRKKSLECITILQGWCQIFFHLSVAKQSWKKKKDDKQKEWNEDVPLQRSFVEGSRV
jgi:hypothetical protein